MAQASEKKLLPFLSLLAIAGTWLIVTVLLSNQPDNAVGFAGDFNAYASPNDYFTGEAVVRIANALSLDRNQITISVSGGDKFYVYEKGYYSDGGSWVEFDFPLATRAIPGWDFSSSVTIELDLAAESPRYIAVFTCKEHDDSILLHERLSSAEKAAMTTYFDDKEFAFICGYNPTGNNPFLNWRVLTVGKTIEPGCACDTEACGELNECGQSCYADTCSGERTCQLTGGSYSCRCPSGHDWDEDSCEPVDCVPLCTSTCGASDGCGGFCSGSCALGQECVPQGATYICQGTTDPPESCSNGIQDEEETGVDCGGACNSCSNSAKN